MAHSRIKVKLALLFIFHSVQTFSQYDFGISRKRLHPQAIDTVNENTVIYVTPNAILYFRQNDIRGFLDNPKNDEVVSNYTARLIRDKLKQNSKRIYIRDVLFFYDEKQRDSIFQITTENKITSELDREFYIIGAALILNGEFMLYSKRNKMILIKGLFAKQKIGPYAQRTLAFYFPDKSQFYYVTEALGE